MGLSDVSTLERRLVARGGRFYERVVAPRLPDTVSASRQWPLIVGLILTGLIAVPGMYWDIGWHIDLGR
ncbi:MAG TPA: hypothetical protein VNT32_06995, partial [Thermoleophilaceae bacterium]|nr:hypothetical protein [Thermoleophilaceae bacterium]